MNSNRMIMTVILNSFFYLAQYLKSSRDPTKKQNDPLRVAIPRLKTTALYDCHRTKKGSKFTFKVNQYQRRLPRKKRKFSGIELPAIPCKKIFDLL